MANFPFLTSGAVTQYPALIVSGQRVQVIPFLDASDQRYVVQPRALRQWQIRLDLLNENEIQALEAFFIAQSGDYSPFNFPDPFSNTTVSNCRLAAPGFVSEYVGVDVTSTSFWVIETNG
jgi:hypothetical protein